jgi:hypothetical protein
MRPAASLLLILLFGFMTHLAGAADSDQTTEGTGNVPSQHHYEINAQNAPSQEENEAEQRDQRMLDLMTQKLNLSPDQQAVVKTTLKDQSTKMISAKNDFLEKIKGVRSDADNAILAALNDDQKKKYLDSKAAMEKEAQNRGPVDGMHFGHSGAGHGGGRGSGGSLGGGM